MEEKKTEEYQPIEYRINKKLKLSVSKDSKDIKKKMKINYIFFSLIILLPILIIINYEGKLSRYNSIDPNSQLEKELFKVKSQLKELQEINYKNEQLVKTLMKKNLTYEEKIKLLIANPEREYNSKDSIFQ